MLLAYRWIAAEITIRARSSASSLASCSMARTRSILSARVVSRIVEKKRPRLLPGQAGGSSSRSLCSFCTSARRASWFVTFAHAEMSFSRRPTFSPCGSSFRFAHRDRPLASESLFSLLMLVFFTSNLLVELLRQRINFALGFVFASRVTASACADASREPLQSFPRGLAYAKFP